METARSEPETPVEPASAPPKRTSRKKKAAKRDKTTKTASTANTAKTPRTATKKGSAAGQLRDLKEGARVVVKVGRKKQTVTPINVTRTRFVARTADGEELDLGVGQFVRAEP